jgi:hypothetical protein
MACLIAAGCATYEKKSINQVPPPQFTTQKGKPDLLTRGKILQKIQKNYPSVKHIEIKDNSYVYITREWLEELITWGDRHITEHTQRIGEDHIDLKGYTQVFSMLLNSAANLAFADRYNIKGSVLLGLMVAENKVSWGPLKGDGEPYDYLIAMTDKGVLVYDPRSKQFCHMHEFPNRHAITSFLF